MNGFILPDIDIVVDEQNVANISWLVPHFVKRNSTLLTYSLSCSTTKANGSGALVVETQNTMEQVQLKPHTTYHCCVSVMSETQLWTPSCTIVTSQEEGTSLSKKLIKLICVTREINYDRTKAC